MAAPDRAEVRRHRRLLLGAAAGATTLGLLWARDPNVPGSYGYCPFRALTGWDCPFCGGLRATHALLHGDVPLAADHNALLVVGGGLLLVVWLSAEVTRRRQDLVALVSGRTAIVAVTVTLVGWTLLRHVPSLHYLASSAT